MGQTPATRKHNARRKAQAKTDSERYVVLRAKGWSVSDIARHFGIAKSTVSQRITEELKAPAEGLDELRALENAKYDRWERELNRLKLAKKDDPDVVVSVHARLARIAELRTRLNGITVPVVEKINLEVSGGVASPSKAREAMHSAFGMIGPEGNTIGPQPGNDSPSIGPDAAQREGPVGAGGKPPAP